MTCCVSCGIIAASDWEGVAYGGEENGPAPLYTRMVVKDALLELLKEKEFSAITVTDICRVAQLISTINEHIESRHTAEFFN